MFLNLTASKDTYIQNKVIGNRFRATDANVGYAGTLDLFKFYGESQLPKGEAVADGAGTYNLDTDADGIPETAIELSRLLVQFDLSEIVDFTTTELDIINDTSFYCELRLFDILDGQMAPTNFSIDIFPLASPFQEGIGRDTSAFGDLDIPNWVTGSYDGLSNPPEVLWVDDGAGTVGNYAGEGEPVVVDAYQFLDDGVTSISTNKLFVEGTENFTFDVTPAIREMLKGTIDNNGFRISFSTVEEINTKTYFLKRFASRHVLNHYLRPRLTIAWDSSFRDNSKNAQFGISNAFMISNINRGTPVNSQYEGVGDDGPGLQLVLSTGSYSKEYDARRLYAAYPTLGVDAEAVNKAGFYVATVSDQELAGDEDGKRVVSAQSEISRIEFVDHDVDNENLNGLYFKMYSDDITDNTHYVWFDVDTAGDDPDPDVAWNDIRIAITPEDTAETIAATAAVAIDASPDFSAEVYSIGVVHVTSTLSGPPVDSASVGTVTTTGFAVETYQAGNSITIQDHMAASGSIIFSTTWNGANDEDELFPVKTGAVKFFGSEQSTFSATARNLDVKVINARPGYKTAERAKFRVFARDPSQEYSAARLPVTIDSVILDEVYYRIRDAISNDIIIPFEQDNNGTRVSTDSGGMYFDVIMSSLFPGRVYTIDLLIIERGNETVIEAKEARFRIDK